jgi:hypothetical protein
MLENAAAAADGNMETLLGFCVSNGQIDRLFPVHMSSWKRA